MLNRILGRLDRVLETVYYKSSGVVAPIISLGLGATTAFFLRDELNQPTFLRIKEAYLINKKTLREEPSEVYLKIIDPIH